MTVGPSPSGMMSSGEPMVSKFRKYVRSLGQLGFVSPGTRRSRPATFPSGPQGHSTPYRPLAQPLDQRTSSATAGEDLSLAPGTPDCAMSANKRRPGRYPPFGDRHRPGCSQGADTGECGREDRPHQFGGCGRALHNPGKQLDHYLLNMSLEKLAAVRGVVVAHNNC